jgi:hypothetical protein
MRFGFTGTADADFDDADEFVPEHLPLPGAFLQGHDVLVGDDHVAVHATAHEVFEERGVYDVTFGYNLARLDRDPRHPEAGYRYARETGNPAVLRADFTPTTPFCPQSDSLTRASFLAWNALDDRHEFDLVRVRVAESHAEADRINDRLARMEERYEESGDLPAPGDGGPTGGAADAAGAGAGDATSDDAPASPF